MQDKLSMSKGQLIKETTEEQKLFSYLPLRFLSDFDCIYMPTIPFNWHVSGGPKSVPEANGVFVREHFHRHSGPGH